MCNHNLLYFGIEETFQPEPFTVPVYDAFADRAVEQGGGSPHTAGVKGHCILNSLKSFHSVTGMPPCLGHDFFEEGVQEVEYFETSTAQIRSAQSSQVSQIHQL